MNLAQLDLSQAASLIGGLIILGVVIVTGWIVVENRVRRRRRLNQP